MTTHAIYYRRPEFFGRTEFAPEEFEFVTEIEAASVGDVFCQMNAVEGDELCCTLGVRSMSVGDVVVVGDQAFLCDYVGWTELPTTAARHLSVL